MVRGSAWPANLIRAHNGEDGNPVPAERGDTWAVVVDDLQGTVHRAYGTLADPTSLIDRDGRVAFVNMVTSVPVLHEAIESLLAQGGC